MQIIGTTIIHQRLNVLKIDKTLYLTQAINSSQIDLSEQAFKNTVSHIVNIVSQFMTHYHVIIDYYL